MSDITFEFLAKVSDWDKIVHQIWTASNQGTFWNTVEAYNFRKVCLFEKYKAKDLSFLIYDDGLPVGFMFFLIYEDKSQWTADYSSAHLYWPCYLNVYANKLDFVEFIFHYIDKICMLNDVEKINMMINASSIEKNTYSHILRKFDYIDESYDSHVIALPDFDIMKIRPRYRQNINKYSNKYKINNVFFDELNDDLIGNYYNLHVLDSGGKHRNYESYVAQFQMFKNGGFVVCAQDENNHFVGMLQILIAKKEAYEASVAIHPDHAPFSISYMLKLSAIEYSKNADLHIFELGKADYFPTFTSVPTTKNYGINFFKDGWSRGKTRQINLAVKFFTENALDRYLMEQKEKILENLMGKQ